MTKELSERDDIIEEFLKNTGTLMGSGLWTKRSAEQWERGTDGWLSVMLADIASSGEIIFDHPQTQVTDGMFELAMHIQADGLQFTRDIDGEHVYREKAWNKYFPEEARINVSGIALAGAFNALIVSPAMSTADHCLAMGRIKTSIVYDNASTEAM